MHYFIDCEFNEFGGELISLALVPIDGRMPEFYVELLCKDDPKDWVKANVVPLLDKTPISLQEAQERYRRFMGFDNFPSIIADHPADIAYFCRFIDLNMGNYIGPDGGYQFTVMPHGLGKIKSARPHHALYDARANRDSYKKR